MQDQEDGSFSAVAQEAAPQELEPTIELTLPGDLPWKVLINGMPYVRRADRIDRTINMIREYQIIAKETGVSLRQAIWLYADANGGDADVLPD